MDKSYCQSMAHILYILEYVTDKTQCQSIAHLLYIQDIDKSINRNISQSLYILDM